MIGIMNNIVNNKKDHNILNGNNWDLLTVPSEMI